MKKSTCRHNKTKPHFSTLFKSYGQNKHQMSLLITRLTQFFCIRDMLPPKPIKPINKTVVAFEEDAKCCVCLSRLQEGDIIKKLPCRHIFHQDCVDQWLDVCQKTCPLCRVSVDSAEDGKHTKEQLNDDLVIWFSAMLVPGF
ncbi:E3 ubiquitin-protein ligase [Rhynchospora pubera]|uniref:E3 ubiquitin-protein ligase n=2 Tax=Rhynchospora pubera TaxID=906938 RepID=A0AAV8GBG7_9POAL|nr:E3 ubiquitin-protein ligase [Rhynchospora pubera]